MLVVRTQRALRDAVNSARARRGLPWAPLDHAPITCSQADVLYSSAFARCCCYPDADPVPIAAAEERSAASRPPRAVPAAANLRATRSAARAASPAATIR